MSLPKPDDANVNGPSPPTKPKNSPDSKVIQNLENEILKTMQANGSMPDPIFNSGQPESSTNSSTTSTLATSLYTSNSMSMESFTLDSFITAGGATTLDYEKRYGTQRKCCGSFKKQVNVETSNLGPNGLPKGIDSPNFLANNLNSSEFSNTNQNNNDPAPVLLPPPAPEDKNKICLVLDLDETLVHSSFLSIPHADFTFVLGCGDNQVGVFVCIRPGAEQFLKELGDLYEIVIFTASSQPYADTVIDYIDPNHVVKYRLYRESCTDFGGNFVKDLSRLNRSLERIIIIDNSPSAYLLQPYNAIAIASWFDEPMDNELLLILDFLKQSYRVKNIYDLFSPE